MWFKAGGKIGVFGGIRYSQLGKISRDSMVMRLVLRMFGRVMSLFSSSVVGVRLSWLFTVILLSNRLW
jgi:hypothetical protein